MWRINSKWVLAVLLTAGLNFGCARDLVTGQLSYNWYSLDTDIKAGQQVIAEQLKELAKKHKRIDEQVDPVMTGKIREITKQIAQVSHRPNFPFEAHYADLDIVNAWCAPGGKVMVYEGLFDPKNGLVRKESEDELAAVLGHEIAHATARHVTESMSRKMSLLVVGQVALTAVSASSASGLVKDMFNRVVEQGINLYLPSYSRGNESEADRVGLIYMAKAGYNPQAAVDLWYRACKQKGDRTSLTASHPSNCSRAKELEKLLPKAMEEYHRYEASFR